MRSSCDSRGASRTPVQWAIRVMLRVLLPMAALALFLPDSKIQAQPAIAPDCVVFIPTTTLNASGTTKFPNTTNGFDNRTLGCQFYVLVYQATGTGSLTGVAFQSSTGSASPTSFGNWPGTVSTGINPSTNNTRGIATFTTGCANATPCNVDNAWLRVLVTEGTFAGTIDGVLYGFKGTPPVNVTGSFTPVGTQDVNVKQINGTTAVNGGLAGSLAIGGCVAVAGVACNPVATGYRDDAGNILADYGFPDQNQITLAAGTDVVVVTGVASTKTYIGHISFASDTPTTVTIQQGTGTTCLTNTVVLYGPYQNTAALALDFDSRGGLHTTVNARDVCLHFGASVTTGGGVAFGQH